MSIQDELRFEDVIYDIIGNEKIEVSEELTKLSENLHNIIERALYDYAFDNDLSDYQPFC